MILRCVVIGLCLAGCGTRPPPAFRDVPGQGPITNPFVPASMIIHPLTRLDVDASGRLWLYCHVEFKDSWGDNVKSTGALAIELYRATGPRASGLGKQELVWNVDLSDLERNASLYDAATRTYRLPLENPPRWLLEPAAAADLPQGRLRVQCTTGGAREGTRTLEDEYPLVR